VFLPANHHLASYGNSRSAASSRGRLSPGASGTRSPRHRHHRDQLPRQPRWHFGIRSSSPPMEVMLELYRTLETLGIQWREKGGIWALHPDQHHTGPAHPGQTSTNEPGSSSDSYERIAKDILDIYYVECRWRVRDAVVSCTCVFLFIRSSHNGCWSPTLLRSSFLICNYIK
jgi:carbon catabolite-derepressing protein kinase